MRLYGLVLAGCASAGTPSEAPDAAIDAAKRDGSIEPPIDAPPNACPSTATCANAMMLGTVSGDSMNQKLMMTGYQSAWFRVRVTENDDNFPGLTLRVGAKVTSPTGVMFDTFVYVNAGNDVVECSTTTGTKSNTGATTQVKAEWGEGFTPNGSDDSRNVSIEVRPVSGNCSPSATWQLEVEGNWL